MICYLESRKKGEATNEEKDDRKHEQPSQFIRRLDKLSMIEATGTDKDHVVGLNMQRKVVTLDERMFFFGPRIVQPGG